jgi:hypothetical protein
MEKESKDQILDELKKLIARLPEESQRRVFYVLDYILNYFHGERRIQKLSEVGFQRELTELMNLGVVVEASEYWRGRTYPKLLIKEELKEDINNLLREKYYPTFQEEEVAEKLREIVRKSLSTATKLWHEILSRPMRSKMMEYPLESQGNVVELGKELAQCGMGYFIGYWSTSWISYSDEFTFRTEPIDTEAIFLKIVEEEVNRVFTSFTPATRWCTYLKLLEPNADERFILNNSTIRFLPAEIKEGFSKLLDLRVEKSEEVVKTIFTKERERLLNVIKTLLNKDSSIVQVIGTLLLLAEEKERYLSINNQSLEKIKEISSYSYERLCGYIKILMNFGVILTSNYGDLIIPKILQEALNDVLKGAAVEIKIFESELDAEAFIEETMARAISNIKIWDPYVSTRTLRIIEKSIKPNSLLVEILSSKPTIADEIQKLINKGMKIKARIIYKKQDGEFLSPFHDRYLIIDQRYVWHFGPSLHAAGEKEWESASLFSGQFSKAIFEAFMYNFSKNDEEWERDGYRVIKKEFKEV